MIAPLARVDIAEDDSGDDGDASPADAGIGDTGGPTFPALEAAPAAALRRARLRHPLSLAPPDETRTRAGGRGEA